MCILYFESTECKELMKVTALYVPNPNIYLTMPILEYAYLQQTGFSSFQAEI